MSSEPAIKRSLINSALAGWGLGLLAGAVVGGTSVVFLAPRSGRNTRMMIKDRVIRSKNRIIYRAKSEMEAVGKKRK